jgi:hypothetical protein
MTCSLHPHPLHDDEKMVHVDDATHLHPMNLPNHSFDDNHTHHDDHHVDREDYHHDVHHIHYASFAAHHYTG